MEKNWKNEGYEDTRTWEIHFVGSLDPLCQCKGIPNNANTSYVTFTWLQVNSISVCVDREPLWSISVSVKDTLCSVNIQTQIFQFQKQKLHPKSFWRCLWKCVTVSSHDHAQLNRMLCGQIIVHRTHHLRSRNKSHRRPVNHLKKDKIRWYFMNLTRGCPSVK